MRVTRWLSCLALCAALAGCAQAPVPADRFYRLLPPAPQVLERPVLPGTLLVKRLSADGLLGQRPILYAESAAPGVLYQYHYHFWADAPPAMLQAVIVQALRAAKVAREVVTPEHGVDAQYVLVGRVRRLEHLLGDAPAVAVSLELAITSGERDAPLVLSDHDLTIGVADAGVDTAASALSEAVGRILSEFMSRLPPR